MSQIGKKALHRSTRRDIRGSLGRFFAIFAIIALGVGFFSGVRITTPAMVHTFDELLKEKNFFDYRLVSTLGWEDQDVEAVKKEAGVKEAEGGMQQDIICLAADGSEEVYKAHLLPEKINLLLTIEGRLPENADEVVLDNRHRSGYKLGDTLTFSTTNPVENREKFTRDSFTIVGFVDSSYYINFERGTTSLGNGQVAGFMYITKEAFADEIYTELFVDMEAEGEIYSEEYNNRMDALRPEWEKTVQRLADGRYERLRKEGEDKIADAKNELAEEKETNGKKLDDAKKDLEDAEKKLKDSEKEIADGEGKLAEAKETLDSAKKELDENGPKLESAKKKLDSGKKTLDETKAKLDAAKKTLDTNEAKLTESKKTLDDTEAQLSESKKKLDATEEKLEGSKKTLDATETKLTAAKTELDLGKAQLEAVKGILPQAQYEAALAEYEAKLEEYQEGFSAFEAGKKQYEEGYAAFEEGKTQYEEGYAAFEEGKTQYEQGVTAFETGKAQYQAGYLEYQKGLRDYQKGMREYISGQAKYESGKKEYEDGLKEYGKSVSDLENGKRELADGKKEYEDGLKEYEDGKKEFEEKIAEAEEKIADAEEKLADLNKPDTFLMERNTNIGYSCFESDSKIVEQIARIFPVFFIMVAALVCMTTMTRMVEEQRGQIGVLKALGYSNGDIMMKYCTYSGTASILGCVIGYGLGIIFFPMVIWVAYHIMYINLDLLYIFDWKLALVSGSVALLCTVGITVLSCRYALSESAAGLMRPKAPRPGKRVFLERVTFIWERLTFLQKVSVRNIFRYKGRLLMMIVGIGGSTALLVTGFGIKDSIADFSETQFGKIQVADAEVVFKEGEEGKAPADVENVFKKETKDYIYAYAGSWDLVYGKIVKSINLIVPDTEGNFRDFFRLNTMSGEELPLPGKGEALISISIAERQNVNVGDTIRLRSDDLSEVEVRVSGVFRSHVYNYVIVSNEDISRPVNTAYVNFPEGKDVYQAQAEIAKEDDVTYITMYRDTRERMAKMMDSLNFIVLIVVLSAAGLAFVVLYNLTNINITERIREIATVKVLGFYSNETAQYVFRENYLLTFFGMVVGLGLGILLHRFVMAQIVVDMVYFDAKVQPVSFGYSVVLTFVFTFLVSLMMRVKLERINMAESLKSVE